MTPSRWQQIERVYHAGLERPSGERGAVLAEVCQNDPDLRREAESLLAQDASKAGTLDRPAWVGEYGLTTGSTVTVISPGTQLGPYRIEVPLGVWGYGAGLSGARYTVEPSGGDQDFSLVGIIRVLS